MSDHDNQGGRASARPSVISLQIKEKAALYKTAQDQIMADQPWAVLTVDRLLFATSKRLSGIVMMPDGNIYSETMSVE